MSDENESGGPKLVGADGKPAEPPEAQNGVGSPEEIKVTKFAVDVPAGVFGLFIGFDPKTSAITAQPIHFDMANRPLLYTMLECVRDIAVQNAVQRRFGLVDPRQAAQVAQAKAEAARLGLDPNRIQ